ncbi:RHS repeat protein [Pseudomonas stutzeri]|uniref:Wall-associated protein n=1 Tax=Stutzerimonas stutzeri TaxID=316 RepID=A0A2N8S6C9_STUST|nr:RHS repeat-associated core domain-containing protein [Stutzerimonas stutzeri]MCQ4297682.1 RHS repeat protein [Stutzerimonas stutzeri]PNF82180.1 Wall-associated protein [Stutzerimonas stutzeri]
MKSSHRISLLALTLATALGVPSVQALERSWSYTYNSLGLIETADGPRTDVSDVTTYTYDAQGHLTQVANALGHVTQLSNFDTYGNPQTLIDANGVTTTLTYAPQGWLSSTSTAGSSTSFEHDAIGQITKVTRGDGSWLQYTWDDARRLTAISNNVGEKVEYDYDLMGNRTAQRLNDASGVLTQQQTWVYDELGRLLRAVGAQGQIRQYGYDLNDNLALGTTPKQHSTANSYDALDRLVASTDPLNGVTALGYDAQDNLTQVSDPRGVTTQYRYDGLGNLTQLVSPDSGTTAFAHDAAGNVIRKTDARGVVTSYGYDALNRLTSKTYPTSPALNIQYHYDMTADGNHGVGRLTAVQDASGVLGYRYDARGNLTQQLRSLEVAGSDVYDTLQYTYDGANQLTRIDYPAGFAVQYQRNAAGQVGEVDIVIDEQPAAFASDLSYMPFGPLKSLTWANGINLSRTYDQDYRLTQQSVGPWQVNYGYDANSNIQSLESGLFGDLLYGYDALDRLTREDEGNQRLQYGYDAVGNRTSKALIGLSEGQPMGSVVTDLSYASDSNRLVSIDGLGVTSDATGSLTQFSNNRTFDYDAQGRSAQVKIGSNVIAQYRYNALGQRIHKITGTATTTFLYGPNGQLLGETRYSPTGAKLSSQFYLWLDSLPLGGITLAYDAEGGIASSSAFYLHADHLNTPRLATNQSGNEVWRWKSDAFGVGAAVGAATINLRFPGQYYDSESGLHYNYFRDYDPETGRYVESDPIGLEGGLNTYGYAYQNPINNFDPDGRLVWFLGLGALGGTGTTATAGAGFWTMGGLVGGAALTASISGSTSQTSAETEAKSCPKNCPPCKTVSGRVVPPGTLGYRPLDVIPDDQMQHGVYGSHHNMFVANQNPNNCQCFWQKQSYVLKPEQLPATAVPVEPFVN